MTEITVKIDAETGAATIELRGAAIAEPRFRLRDAENEKFLTRRGWSKTPSFLPGEAVTAADFTVLALDAELARRINPGMKLVLEQPTSNIFANLAWPGEVAPEEETGEGEEANPEEAKSEEETPEESKPEEAKSEDEELVEEADMTRTEESEQSPETVAIPDAEREAASSEVEATTPGADAPVDGERPGSDTAPIATNPSAIPGTTAPLSDEPMSLEPAIRDEATTPYRSQAPVPVVAKDNGRSRSTGQVEDDDDDDDDDDSGWPWGKLVAAALIFTVLGSVLTYFWQNSAYDNELRTAMRAVEAQRDEIKSDLEKRLAEAEAKVGQESSAAVTAAEASLTSLTEKAETLTRDRDVARGALAEQEAKTKTLEERLATAQGEIQSLKQAAEADATEQGAVFNDRIEALGKELDGARSELETARAELVARNQSIATGADELTQAREEIAALKKAAEENRVAQNEELEGRIRSLSAQLDKAVQDLATRDQSLRDVQAKLSVADVQIEALKQVAGKATSADLEKATLADKVAELTAQVEKSGQDLASKQAALKTAETSLAAANALLAKNAADIEKLKDQPVAAQDAPVADAASDAATEQLKQERDLYAKELAAMTESLNSLKAERDRLASATGDADQNASPDTANAATESRAVWGATAIDPSGAIYSLQNQIAENTASENVVALCKGKSNGSCETLRTYSNTCFSLARIEGEGPKNDNFGFSMDKDWKKAEAGAIRQCEELGATCTVRFTVCSPDTLSKPAAAQ